MTKSRQFTLAWADQTKTISAQALARQMDPEVTISRHKNPEHFKFLFSDGSLAITEGRGRSFKIWSCK